jgi:aspartate/methionine/tyrosine aminotransferase
MAQAELDRIRTMRDVFDYCARHGLYSVAQGMIELPPPRRLRELVAEECLRDSHEIHQYGARIGGAPYLDAVVSYLKRRYGASVPRDGVMAIAGVSGGIVSTLLSLRTGGKKQVALLEPFYTYHSRQSEAVFGTPPMTIPAKSDLTPDWAGIEKALKGGVDALILTNPNNPSGRVWPKDDIVRLVRLCESTGSVLIVDEIYCDMVWRGQHYSPVQMEPLSENVVVCRGWAKSVAAQSWRIGFLVTHPSRLQQILTAHDPVYIAVNWAQYAIARYITDEYEDYEKHVDNVGKIMQANWALLKAALQEELGWEPVEPDGTMYGLFKHHCSSDMDALKKGLEHGIGVATGNMFFGGNVANSGYIRIHYGFATETAQKIADVVRQKGKAIRAHKQGNGVATPNS